VQRVRRIAAFNPRKEFDMNKRTLIRGAAMMALMAIASVATPVSHHAARAADTPAGAAEDGIVTTRSAYPMAETIDRITRDVAAKGILLFEVIDQAKLAKDAGIELRPSTLIVFGNPPLGTLFLTARAEAGLDWPVRLLVFEDAWGQVRTAHTDFDWIARRHGIENREAEFAKASEVIASIVASVTQ
jgi:uncharacterized protein (DUF302 family)